jgi:hypothetical protein
MAFIDCFLRSPVLQADDMLAVTPLLLHASHAVQLSELGANTVAVAGLASACTSFAKRAVQLTKAAGGLQDQPDAAAAVQQQGHAAVAAACFPAVVPVIVDEVLKDLARLLNWPIAPAGPEAILGYTTENGRLVSHVAATSALLAVVLARSLAQLADAMQTARAELLYKCLLRRPKFTVMWLSEEQHRSGHTTRDPGPRPGNGEEQHSGQLRFWQYWQQRVLQALQPLLASMRSLGMAPAAPTAAAAAAVGPAANLQASAGPMTGMLADEEASSALDQSSSSSSTGSPSNEGSSRSNSSSSSAQQVKWGYLLWLQQCSPRWAAAVAAFDAKWPDWEAVATADLPASLAAAAAEQLTERFDDAASLCRVLAAAAPITVVCNNLKCDNLAGVSEAAASCKACSGCSCRCCSVACQRADWRRLKDACRQLAAAGYSSAS